jgi:hypothetical protein
MGLAVTSLPLLGLGTREPGMCLSSPAPRLLLGLPQAPSRFPLGLPSVVQMLEVSTSVLGRATNKVEAFILPPEPLSRKTLAGAPLPLPVVTTNLHLLHSVDLREAVWTLPVALALQGPVVP